MRRFLELTLGHIDRFAVQTDADSERLLELGVEAERVAVTGNLKYELREPEPRPELEARLESLAAGRPILIAGSTMRGEESSVIEAFRALGSGARALLVLAPRHPERWSEVERLVAEAGFAVARRSDLETRAESQADVLLLDSLGELAGLYRIAAAAFVGGTLTPTGGHNPLEPARFGVPVVVGPSMENFRQIAEEFDRLGAWRRVTHAGELAGAWTAWLDDPDQARNVGGRGAALVSANRGALDRTIRELDSILELFRPAP